MDYERYEGGRGQEVIVKETDVVVMKDGEWVKTYYFDNNSISVEATGNAGMGAAVGGLVGAAIASGVSANYRLHITNTNGTIEKVPLYLSGKEANRLELQIKGINRRRAKAAEKEISACKYSFDGYPASSYIGRIVLGWLFSGGFIVFWFKLFSEYMFDSSRGETFLWIMPGVFLLLGVFITLTANIMKKQMLASIEVNPEKLVIDKKEFDISKIRGIKVSPIDRTGTLPIIKFEYEGKKYKYMICKDRKNPAFNTPATNKEYQELLSCFRTIYKDKPDVLVAGF